MTFGEFISKFGDLGWAGVVLALAWMVFTGRLVPRGHVEQLLAIWQKAYEISEKSREQQGELIKDAVEAVETSAEIVKALRDAPRGSRGGQR